MKKIKADIADHHFEPVYLICGPEAYLRRSIRQALHQAVVGDDTMNYAYREGREVDVTEVKDLAETLPFFADRRLILLENSGLFKKGGDELAEYLPSLPDSTVLVFCEEEADKRSRLYKAVAKCGYVVECARMSEEDLKKFVLSYLGKAQLKITQEALELFLERCGEDMNHLVTELEKLSAYAQGKPGIRREEVEAITSVTVQNRVFDMLDAMTLGHPREALLLYEDLRALREPPMRLLYLITQQVNRLLQVKELEGQGLRPEAIAEATGLRSFAVKKYARQASRFTGERLALRLEKLAQYDNDIKNGRISDELALELVLAEFGGRYD